MNVNIDHGSSIIKIKVYDDKSAVSYSRFYNDNVDLYNIINKLPYEKLDNLVISTNKDIDKTKIKYDKVTIIPPLVMSKKLFDKLNCKDYVLVLGGYSGIYSARIIDNKLAKMDKISFINNGLNSILTSKPIYTDIKSMYDRCCILESESYRSKGKLYNESKIMRIEKRIYAHSVIRYLILTYGAKSKFITCGGLAGLLSSLYEDLKIDNYLYVDIYNEVKFSFKQV